MSTSLAYHTQGIVGFQHHSFQYSEGEVIQRLKRKEFRCPKCVSLMIFQDDGLLPSLCEVEIAFL